MFRKSRLIALGSLVVLAATSLVAHQGVDAVANTACEGPAAGEEPNWGNENPRLITSKEDLVYLSIMSNDSTSSVAASFLNANYRLTADINLGGCLWDPIGSSTSSGSPVNSPPSNRFFTGVFDGDGYSISGFNVESSEELLGLFGAIRGGTFSGTPFSPVVRDLTLLGTVTGTRTSSGHDLGGLAGYLGEDVHVENVHVDVDVSATSYFGHNVGGLAGVTDGGNGTITKSSSSGDVSGRGSNVGGLVGYTYGSDTVVSYSFSTGVVSVERIPDPDFEPDARFIGRAGGLIGYNNVSIQDSYATGSVTSTKDDNRTPDSDFTGTGALVGVAWDGTVSRAFATGLVSAVNPQGGLIGALEGSSQVVTDSFWDSETTGLSASAGGFGTAKTTVQMTSLATFSHTTTSGLTNAWDIVEGWQVFDSSGGKVWGICSQANDGYPFLLWEYDANPCGASGGASAPATKPRPTGSPGIFLTVTGGPGDQVAGRQVVIGSYAVSPRSPYALTVQPSATQGGQIVLASGFTNPGGHLEREIVLPRLSPGSHTIVLVGRGSAGELLALRNVVVVDANGRFSSITPEALQPRLR